MENKEDSPLLQEEQVSAGEETQEREPAATVNLDVNEPQAVLGFPAPIGDNDRWVITMGDHRSLPRQPWSTDFNECFGSDDEFCWADMKICMLGTCCPCILYGLNMERLKPGKTSFFFDCCVYTSLCLGSAVLCELLNLHLCCNAVCLYTFPGRTFLRKAHNLNGYGDCLEDQCRCCLTKSKNHEECDSFCDICLHCFCHRCALCQEGREIHRRTVQFDQASLLNTSAPSRQTMESISHGTGQSVGRPGRHPYQGKVN